MLTNGNILPSLSAVFFIAGVLLIFEIIRPFRDLHIDGPIAMVCWIIGFLTAAFGLWFHKGTTAFNVTALSLNLLALIALFILLLLLGSIKKLF